MFLVRKRPQERRATFFTCFLISLTHTNASYILCIYGLIAHRYWCCSDLWERGLIVYKIKQEKQRDREKGLVDFVCSVFSVIWHQLKECLMHQLIGIFERIPLSINSLVYTKTCKACSPLFGQNRKTSHNCYSK